MNMADAGEVLAGKWGREILGVAQMLFFVFVMASHLLTFTVAMNTLTDHGTCSIVFGVVGMVVSFILCLPRTLEKMSWLSLVCMCISPNFMRKANQKTAFISIFSAVMICMIGIGISKPGADNIVAVVDTDLYHGFTAVTNIVFAFCTFYSISFELLRPRLTLTGGHAAFFGLAAELKDPRDFPKGLCLLQGIDICLYLVAAVVIYRFGGADVSSPALGSAGPIVGKVAYGIALPTVCFQPRHIQSHQ